VGDPSFEVPRFAVDAHAIESFECSPLPAVRDVVFPRSQACIYLHPASLARGDHQEILRRARPNGKLEVSPSSSTRTVVVRGVNPIFMLKLDLRERLGQFQRFIGRDQVLQSHCVTAELSSCLLPAGLGFLPETICVVFPARLRSGTIPTTVNGSPATTSGFMVRELSARPASAQAHALIPAFALFAPDPDCPEDYPLLAQIVHRRSCARRIPEIDVFIEELLEPLVTGWWFLVRDRGLICDIHAQNLLLEVNREGKPLRWIVRDLQDTVIDDRRRRDLGLSLSFTPRKFLSGRPGRPRRVNGALLKEIEDYRFSEISFQWDYQVGTKVLRHFETVLGILPSCTPDRIRSAIRSLVRAATRDAVGDFLPRKAYHLAPASSSADERLFVEEDPVYR
jgi:hypothetical protein